MSTTEKLIQWKISTRHKKSIIEVETFRKGDVEFSIENGWRWGYITLLVPEGVDLIAELDPENNERVNIDGLGYDSYDRDLDDGVWVDWNVDALDEGESMEVQDAWEEDDYEGLENIGWQSWDSELFFDGPLDVENLGEYVTPTYDEEEDDED